MKVAFVGIYGIPNQYGGFEGFIEKLAVKLKSKIDHVTVYNTSTHSYKQDNYKDVNIKVKSLNKVVFKSAAPIVYDFLCLLDARKNKYDVIFQCGYSSSIWIPFLFFSKRIKIYTLMDGLEMKRPKWNKAAKIFLKFTEMLAVKYSTEILSDHPVIQEYYAIKYKTISKYIPYGIEDPITSLNINKISNLSIINNDSLKLSDILQREYYLVISRIEPENNLKLIIEAYLKAQTEVPLIIVGDLNSKLGFELSKKLSNNNSIVLLGGIFDKSILDYLRLNCKAYLHGHTVGGTNPSLLEAISCKCFIIAHDNEFNRYVMQSKGSFFKSAKELELLLRNPAFHKVSERDLSQYEWPKILKSYEDLILDRV